jgi:hypothetical protein
MIAAATSDTVDPSPLLASGGGGGEAEEERDHATHVPHLLLAVMKPEDEEQVPSVGTFWSSVKRWYARFHYPIKVVGWNMISLVLVQALVSTSVGSSALQNAKFKTMLRIGLMISLLTFVVDAYICLQAARRMEQKQKEEQGTPQNHGDAEESLRHSQAPLGGGVANPHQSATPDPEGDFDFIKMSRRVDATFGCASRTSSRRSGSSSSSTFLVGLLYAFFSLAVLESVQSGITLLQVQFIRPDDILEKGRCFASGLFSNDRYYYNYQDKGGISSLKKSPDFAKLPSDVSIG